MSVTPKSLDIIIPTKDSIDDLTKCLFSLNQHLNFNNYKIEIVIISDNSSAKNDQNLCKLIKKFKQINKKLEIKLILLKEKNGMTVALNAGIDYCLTKKSSPTYIGFLHDDSIISNNWETNLIKVLNENVLVFGAGSITYNNFDQQSVRIQKNQFNEQIKSDQISKIQMLDSLVYQSLNDVNEFIDLNIEFLDIENNYNLKKSELSSIQKIVSKNGLQSLTDEEKIKFENAKESFKQAELNFNEKNKNISNLKNKLEEPFINLNNLLISKEFQKLEPIIYNKDFNIDKEPERSEQNIISNSSNKISLFGSIFRSETFKKFGKFDEDLISSYRIEDEYCKRLIIQNIYTSLVPNSFVFHKCKSLNNNLNMHNNILLRNATLYNIELKYSLNSSNYKKPYIIYTCVFNDEKVPKFKNYDTTNFEYICFTNKNDIFGSSVINPPWKFIHTSKFDNILNLNYQTQLNKIKGFFKFHPHFFFKNYNMSIWINPIDLLELPSDLINIIRLTNKDHICLSLESTTFDCAYKELIYNFKNEIISQTMFNNILNLYRSFRYPQNNGLVDSSFIGFKHNEESCKQVLNKIWYFIKNYSSNDKFFVNLCFWLYKQSYSSIYNSLFFNYILKDE